MSQSLTTQDLQNLLGYPFRDPNWKNKLLVGSAVSLASLVIPILPSLFLYGYCAQIVRRIVGGDGETHLPEWDDWGRYFVDGLKLFGVGLVYGLPLIVLFLIGFGLLFGMSFAPVFMVDSAPGDVASLFLVMTAGSMALVGLGILLAVAIGLVVPVALGHVVATDDFAAGFRIGEWWPIFRANVAGFLVSYAILIGLNLIFSLAAQILYFTVILCCLMPVVSALTSTYLTLVGSALFARAYRAGAMLLPASADVDAA